MIGRLRGVLVSSRESGIVIDVGGIGYEVAMTTRDLATLPGIGEDIVVHTHTHVREEELSLFGFGNEPDRDLFRILLGASGVGPKVAMALLASMTNDEIVRAITGEDPDALTIAPGVGKRGAQKIVLELGPKLAGRETEVVGARSLGGVRQALEGLGYSTAEINAVVGDLDPDDPIEAQVKTALQRLGKR
ncbi:MAG TPA: Holliday junction branch migration protein RuvA [Acidimicrobiia bacterium]|nr:Holliday junction branch migration protein RuvA [Acidimicrobiia bacterium]